MKKFFNAVGRFLKQNYKALAAIILTAVISGGVLAIANDVFFITEEERLNRDLSKIYAAESFTQIIPASEFKTNEKYGEVIYVYEASDGTFVIKAKSAVKGFKGYSEIVIAIALSGEIKNVIVSSFGGDDRISSINEKYLKNVYTGKNVFATDYFYMGGAPKNGVDVSSGATSKATMHSVCAAVNMAVYYFKNAGGGWAE